jgi:hypothetical protein
VRESHSLSQASLAHLLLSGPDADSVEVLVQEKIKGNLHEAKSSQDVANVENPVQVVRVAVALGEPDIES